MQQKQFVSCVSRSLVTEHRLAVCRDINDCLKFAILDQRF